MDYRPINIAWNKFRSEHNDLLDGDIKAVNIKELTLSMEYSFYWGVHTMMDLIDSMIQKVKKGECSEETLSKLIELMAKDMKISLESVRTRLMED